MNDITEKFLLIFVCIVILFVIGAIVVSIILSIMGYTNEEIIEITIKDKYIKTESNRGRYYVVDTQNNTYQIRDLLFIGKFNSTDIYNQLEINKTYKVKTTGYRINFWSMYKNINEILGGE